MILIADIGNPDTDPDGPPYLACHTDLTECCGNNDTGGQGGRGEWYYPDGRMVQNNGMSANAGESFLRGRNLRTVNLLRRTELNPLSPTGSYCCVVPTTRGNRTFCANLGMLGCLQYNLLSVNHCSRVPLPQPD